MSWRKITFIVVALIVLLGGSAALSLLFVSMKPEPKRRPDVEMVRYVKADTIKYADVVSSLMREGWVISSNEVNLVSEASGKIEAGDITLKKGTSFKKGELIAVIYKDEVELALKSKKSAFLNSFTNILPDLKVDFPDAYQEFLTYFNQIDIGEDLSELPEVKEGKLKIFLASRNILNQFYTIRQDEKRLNRHFLYAPFDGTFTKVNSEVGAYVNTGAQIATMIRTDQLEIEVPVEGFQSDWINIGDKVIAHSDRGNKWRGQVVRKADFVDADTQSRSLFIKLQDNGRHEVLAGELFMVEFMGQVVKNAMEIPRSAVFNTNEVFTVEDGKLKKKMINILKWNETTLIFNGLEENGRVVTEPLINVKENSLVGILGENQPANTQGKKGGKDKVEARR